jgi:hypothetical protein
VLLYFIGRRGSFVSLAGSNVIRPRLLELAGMLGHLDTIASCIVNANHGSMLFGVCYERK